MFFISSPCSVKKRIDETIQDLLRFGIKNIELSGNLTVYEQWEKDIRFLKDSEKLNLLIHNYFPPPLLKEDAFVLNIASTDKKVSRKSLELIGRAFEFINDFDVPLYSLHGGHNVDMAPELKNMHFIVDKKSKRNKEESSEVFYGNLEKVITEMLPDNKKIAVENLFPFSKEENYCLMTLPEEIEKFLEYSQKYENVGLLLDLGHLNVAGLAFNFDPIKYAQKLLSEYPSKIFQLHLSDNDGTTDLHRVCESHSWQLKLIEDFYDIVKDIPIVFEWSSKVNAENEIRDGIGKIKSRFGQNSFIELDENKSFIYEK